MSDGRLQGALSAHDYVRAAKYLLGEYGRDAHSRASARAAQLAGENTPVVHEMWRVLAQTIGELERGQR
jgi:hypothetical protein